MEQASLSIGTIGQRLEAARQSKGVSVSEAGQATKILSKFIEAMEHDDFGALSAPVYAKSFIKMYAQYLGLDSRPLVDEYVETHAPRAKAHLTDEVRQNLASVDHVPVDASNSPAQAPPKPKGNGKAIFSEVNDTIVNMPGTGIPLKMITYAAGAVAVLLLIVFGVKACAGEDAEVPAATGAASVERQLIAEDVPDVYLVKPGVVEVDK
ncbi:hypothetical protein PDESU_03473 [Pontiella desulfatans]|uniref:Cytoskeleton protein RodZ n=1 Tax=Pontiella desulfatans TaxID=2750659 RepID=A0A6C2U4U1_PONDE|nr:helix-turn-helix transcriptional regulator [Pontiella desulfatans]VGO14903.1 hypothetical protein PDESU_03473 [Pontiella desulfatans]